MTLYQYNNFILNLENHNYEKMTNHFQMKGFTCLYMVSRLQFRHFHWFSILKKDIAWGREATSSFWFWWLCRRRWRSSWYRRRRRSSWCRKRRRRSSWWLRRRWWWWRNSWWLWGRVTTTVESVATVSNTVTTKADIIDLWWMWPGATIFGVLIKDKSITEMFIGFTCTIRTIWCCWRCSGWTLCCCSECCVVCITGTAVITVWMPWTVSYTVIWAWCWTK